MKNKKMLTIAIIVMVLTALLVPTFALADPISGYITVSDNDDPVINTFTVTNATGALTPYNLGNLCTVTLEVTDLDGWDTIDDIDLVFWYTTTAGDPTDIPAYDNGTDDSSQINGISVWSGGAFTADLSDTTWISPTPLSVPDGGTVNNFTFTFDVTIGKEAMKVASATDTDKWVIAAKVTDENGATDFQVLNVGSPLAMNYYGEMDVDSYAAPYWNNGVPGLGFGDAGASAQVFDGDLQLICNGDYFMEVTAATTWDDGYGSDITYDTNNDTNQDFSLAIDTTGTYSALTAQTLANDADANGFTEPFNIDNNPVNSAWGTRTTYDGVFVNNIYMFLATNAAMIASDPDGDGYTGTINFNMIEVT